MVAKPRGRASRRRADEMTEAEMQALREAEAQHYFGISAEEWARRWHAGEYAGRDDSRTLGLAMLFHFV